MWRILIGTATTIMRYLTPVRARRRSGIFPGVTLIGSAFGSDRSQRLDAGCEQRF